MADNAQSILRRLREIKNDPQGVLAQLMDNIQNFNKGRKAEINDQGAGYRTLTPKERTAQIVGGALENIGGGGMGALGVIKGKGGNWLTGSVENALEPLKRTYQRGGNPFSQEQVDFIRANPEAAALNKWIEGPLTKYVKRDMATPEDPVRTLAEQGILHIPEQVTSPSLNARFLRSLHYSGQVPKGTPFEQWEAGAKQAQEGVAKSDLAKQWENLSDSSLDAESIASYLDPDTYFHAKQEPWMQTANPDASVFRIKGQPKWLNRPEYVAGDLGFDHLTDELANALNPESGLPRNLLLTPEQMQQMGMEKAVRHVADINTWRAAQKAEADLARSQNPATRLHKEYPENNPLGLRWVELQAPREAPEDILASLPEADRARYQRYIESGDTPVEAMRGAMGDDNPLVNSLKDALKYEGDTMGHCVGGYCDDVLSGRSRIFSLRDAKGQPHVTIEAGPPRTVKHDEVIEELKKNPNFDKMSEQEYTDAYEKALVDLAPSRPARIVQIKGKANQAPKGDYLPFVQDFVKSGKWYDVGDLKNAGMWKNRHTGEYHTLKELEGNEALQDIYASRNLDENGNWIGGYARGGRIETEDDFAYPGMF